MSAAAGAREHGAHPLSWLVGCVLAGWLIVYNVMRLTGSSPAGSAWISLAVGGAAGLVAFAAGYLILRRMAASGRVLRAHPGEVPPPAALDATQRRLVTLTWPLLGLLALAALVMGVALGADWFGAAADDRAVTLLVLAAWNLLVAAWVGDEALRLQRGEADGIDSVALGAALTAVLAGVGHTRDYIPAGQTALIIIAGLAGAAAALLVWRLRRTATPPVAAPLVVIVAVLSLVLPHL